MNVERGKFEDDPSSAEDAKLEARIAAAIKAVSQDPAYMARVSPADEAEADAQAIAAIEAGRFVSHEQVTEWLNSWGREDYKPMPREWLE